jgi:hypothetical protein
LPLLSRTLRPGEVVLGALALFGGWALGTLVINRVESLNEMSGLSRDGVALLVGTCLMLPACALPLAEQYVKVLLGCLCVITLTVSWSFRRPSFAVPNTAELLALIVAFTLTTLLSVGNGDLMRGSTRLPVTQTASISEGVFDAEFFTSMVATMRHGTITSAIFEKGSPLAYQIVGGFAPAAFAAASGAPSQVALWGVWVPLFKILGLLLIAEIAIRFIAPVYRSRIWIGALLVSLFIFLQPLHPIYLVKGVPKNFVWPGMGWLWGGLELSTISGIVWAALALAMAFPAKPARRLNRSDLVFLGVVMATLLSVKVPIFFAVGTFLTTVGLIRAWRGDRSLIFTLVAAAPFSLIIYSWAFQGSTIATTFGFGYLPRYFAGLFKISGDSPRVLIIGALTGIALCGLWGAIRWFGIAVLFGGLKKTELKQRGQEAAVATLAALLGCCTVATCLNIVQYRGLTLETLEQTTDHSFNLLQFPTSAFFLVSVFGLAGLLTWILSQGGLLRSVSISVVGIWCLIAAISLVLANTQSPKTIDDAWLRAVLGEVENTDHRLMAIDPSLSYPGLSITSADVGPFWVAQNHINKTASISYRWKVFNDALSGDSVRQNSACEKLKAAGVDTLIATVETESQIENFSRVCGFQRPAGHRWVWELIPASTSVARREQRMRQLLKLVPVATA